MLKNATVAVYPPTITRNSEGTVIKGFSATPSVSIRMDVQPYTADESEIAAWGINTRRSEIKKGYVENNSGLALNARVYITIDADGSEGWYDVRATNVWPNSMKVIFTPIQGK